MSEEKYCFNAEWYDPNAELIRPYKFFFYPKDNTIEMYDMKIRRFLKRSEAVDVSLEKLYIGSTIKVHSRKLVLISYGDAFTKEKLGPKKERTFAMIKPDAYNNMGKILDLIVRSGFLITQLKMMRLSRSEAAEFYNEHAGKPFLNDLLGFMTSGTVIAMELMGEKAVSRWRSLLGPTDSAEARSEAPQSIRAKFGTDNRWNACHGADSPKSAARELEFFFPSTGPARVNTAILANCTCCVIKPHAVIEGKAGAIIRDIQEDGFEISAMQIFHLEKANAEEFLEVYKGVVQEYPSMVAEMTSGPCVVMEVRQENAVVAFRKFVGPADAEIAKNLRPRTLRAKYGKNKIQNAVHCTDLPEDGVLEVEYFFRILDR